RFRQYGPGNSRRSGRKARYFTVYSQQTRITQAGVMTEHAEHGAPESADHPYSKLSPDQVLDAVEELGLESNARVFALNSYENRVYQIGLESGEYVIAKFYRPGRWTDAQILEEHEFASELAELEIPV